MADIQKILREHPDCRKIQFAGEKRDFLLGGYGLDKAAHEGLDPMAAFEQGESGVTAFAKLLYAGLVPFNDDLSFEEVLAYLSMQEMLRLQEELADVLPQASEEEIAAFREDASPNEPAAKK